MKKLIKFFKSFFSLKGLEVPHNFIIALFLIAALSSFKGELRQQKEKTKQCIGITKKGERCKRKLSVNTISNYCFQHNVETDKKNKK